MTVSIRQTTRFVPPGQAAPAERFAFMKTRPCARCLMVLLLIAAAFPFGRRSECSEPAKEFLERLRDVQYYDTAIQYLDRIASMPGVDPVLIESIDLERAQIHVDAALSATQATQQEDSFRLAEENLTSFLKAHAKHSRSSQARLQLGRLQMVRAQTLLATEPDDDKRETARKIYLSASGTFKQITETLRETLKSMRGSKVDPKTQPDQAAKRDQYRYEFLQAQYNAGETQRLAAATYTDPAKDAKRLLQQAEEQFAALEKDYGDYVQGALATVALGKTQQAQNNFEKAKLSYLRMLERPDSDPIREAKLAAMQGLMEIAIVEKSPDYSTVIDRGRKLADSLRPNEMKLPATQDFRVALAKSYLAKSEDDAFNSAIRKRASSDARRFLLAAEKVGGPHVEETKELLASLGIDRNEVVDVEVQDPQSVDDALSVARTFLQEAETLAEKVKGLKGDLKVQADKELAQTRTKGIEVLRSGLAMVDSTSDIESVNSARQFLTYFLLLEGRYRETAAVGSFLARTAPGTDTGKNSGLWALTALQQLLVESGDNIDDGLATQVQQLGDYLTATWPNDPQTAQAQGVMIRIALRKSNFDEASKLIAKIDNEAERASMQQLTGQVLWAESLKARRDGNTDKENELRAAATETLITGLSNMPGKLAGPSVLDAALSLAKAQLRSSDASAAMKTLSDSRFGPLALLDKIDAPTENFRSDVYATELNAAVGMMTEGKGDQQALLKQIDSAMSNLRESVSGQDAQQTLVDKLLRLAKELREQLDDAPITRREQFVQAFEIFLGRIANNSDDTTINQWVAQESLSLGESLIPPGQVKAAGRSLKLIETATSALEKIEKASKEKSPALLFQLGRAKRLLGEYPAALNLFESLLAQTPQMLDAQVEAALTYEQWAAVIKPKHAASAYRTALNGGRPGKDGKNVIWGWGKISTAAQRAPQFQETFYDARYHIASCRFAEGKARGSDKIINQAMADITSVHALFRAMGGPEQKAKFNALLKQIQAAAGKPAVGLPK